MLSYRQVVTAFGCLLALSGCTSVDHMPTRVERTTVLNTQFMPKGYTYQDNTPLSSPQPSSPWVASSVISNTDDLATNTTAWQGAIFELIAAMEPYLPKDGTPLNLSAETGGIGRTPHTLAFDHYLRQGLLQKGYTLTTEPKAGLAITYRIQKIKKVANTYVLKTTIKTAHNPAGSSAAVTAILPHEEK